MHSFADAPVRAVNQQCTHFPNISPSTKKRQTSRALLLQEATSRQEQWSEALTLLQGTELPRSHWDAQQKGRLSSASFCNSLLAWAASEVEGHPLREQGAMAAP